MATIPKNIDTETVRQVWDDLNKLTLQVAQLKGKFVLLIDPVPGKRKAPTNNEPLLKPAHRRK